MADRFLEGDATRNALAHENVAGMEIGVEEIVDEQHVEEAHEAQIGDLGVLGRGMLH